MRQIWEETAKQLQKVYDRREAENISFILLEDLFGVRKADVLVGTITSWDEDKLQKAIVRLLNHEPVQYVTGVADFYGRKFKVAPGVLVPRPETEELVQLILKENKIPKPKILDVGLGSGCIAITLALELNVATFGTDVSDKAIEIARENAERLKAKVGFYVSDIHEEPIPEKELDILVSNPPYIPEGEGQGLHPNVTEFEPHQALFVPDGDPLIFYRKIAERGKEVLKKGGKIYVETHERYGDDTRLLFESAGYRQVNVLQDMQGKDRMISALY